MATSFLEYARRRVAAFLEEVEHIAESEFPYQDSEDALKQLRSLFERKLARLQRFTDNSHQGVVTRECTLSLEALFRYLPRLGFILRSTNVRNAFELFGPILRLAREVLEPGPKGKRKTRLLLSSEWDYSLLTFREDPHVPHFVLIGLPAHESSNPLLIPLVGHELGHSVWARNDLRRTIAPTMVDAVVSVLAEPGRLGEYRRLFHRADVQESDLLSNRDVRGDWQPCLIWATKQAEETFCDCLGLNIFGTSFLKAFAYLLSPNPGLGRSLLYPDLAVRIKNQIRAANSYGVSVPDDYARYFRPDKFRPMTPGDAFRLAIADEAVQRTVDALIEKASEIVGRTKLVRPNEQKVADVQKRLGALVPADRCDSLAVILNAAWSLYDNYPAEWDDIPSVRKDKAKVLRELTLKTIEVFEIECIQEGDG